MELIIPIFKPLMTRMYLPPFLFILLIIISIAGCRDSSRTNESGFSLRQASVQLSSTQSENSSMPELDLPQSRTRAPEFPDNFAWVNTDRPLFVHDELKGRVVVLDFWTYCCINCMHVLPDLAFLEEKYKSEPFQVIGVHSAKFENEASRETIR